MNEKVKSRNEVFDYVEFLNKDVSVLAREIEGRVAILTDLEDRNVVGYRVYEATHNESQFENLLTASKAVEQWWLERGMHHFDGAPAAIFALRQAIKDLEK